MKTRFGEQPDSGDEAGIEVSQVHAVPGARRRFQRLPVRDAPAGLAVDPAQGSIAPDVRCGGLRMGFDLDGAELEVDPWPTDTTAHRAIAVGGDLGRGRQGKSNRATVT